MSFHIFIHEILFVQKSYIAIVQIVFFVYNFLRPFYCPILKPAGAIFESIELENPANPQSQSVTYFYRQTNWKRKFTELQRRVES